MNGKCKERCPHGQVYVERILAERRNGSLFVHPDKYRYGMDITEEEYHLRGPCEDVLGFRSFTFDARGNRSYGSVMVWYADQTDIYTLRRMQKEFPSVHTSIVNIYLEMDVSLPKKFMKCRDGHFRIYESEDVCEKFQKKKKK